MKKLRRFYDAEKLAEIYSRQYDHTQWEEHRTRVRLTVDIAQRLIDTHHLTTAADWSAGDRAITNALTGLDFLYTADGAIELTLDSDTRLYDLFICTETIEHLEAPWTVLEKIAKIAKFIVVSTPIDEDPEIDNYEHYWSFTTEDVRDMLTHAGFVELNCTRISSDDWTYAYQIWTGRMP